MEITVIPPEGYGISTENIDADDDFVSNVVKNYEAKYGHSQVSYWSLGDSFIVILICVLLLYLFISIYRRKKAAINICSKCQTESKELNMILNKRFLLYERYERMLKATDNVVKIGSLVYEQNLGDDVYSALEAIFYKSCENEFPAIICEITKNSNLVMSWPNETLSKQVQGILHYAIYLSRDILPANEDKEYIFYRHGNDIYKWIRGDEL